MPASSASPSGGIQVSHRGRATGEAPRLMPLSCPAAFITGRAVFLLPVPMLDRPLSLVIPAHNEAPNMPKVIAASVAALNGLAPDWEVILVDDGSTDETVALARVAMGVAVSRLR